MVSQRLADFLLSWCNPETDPEAAVALLHGPNGAYYLEWLPGELGAAIRAHELTPRTLEGLTGLYFEDQQAVDDWLHELWQEWFTEPYPSD